jgi:L-ascorbate metabolism protein UlaG (beta-lactamase superfamily)
MDHASMTATDANANRITWLGHSTVVVELDGTRVITDPVLKSRLVHLRRVAPRAGQDVLRGLDAALVSHLHYDHLDTWSLRRLGRDLHVVAPVGAGKFLRRKGFANVTELDVGEETSLGAVAIRATPAEHDGARGPFARGAPALGYVVSGSMRVYFAGDTDLFDGMAGLAQDLDVALLPVAGWGPALPAGHLDPENAARALTLLRPRIAVPIHWGTYRRIGMARDPDLRAPAEAFASIAAELAPQVDVRVLPVGGSLELPASAAGASARDTSRTEAPA